MKGFKDFIMRGNLVELAVAFVMGAAFATVVSAFTAMLLSILGAIGGQPNFDTYRPGGVPVGPFLTALVTFVIIAAAVYFLVIKPYEAARTRFARQEEDAAPPEDVQLLKEIRDLLAGRASSAP